MRSLHGTRLISICDSMLEMKIQCSAGLVEPALVPGDGNVLP